MFDEPVLTVSLFLLLGQRIPASLNKPNKILEENFLGQFCVKADVYDVYTVSRALLEHDLRILHAKQ